MVKKVKKVAKNKVVLEAVSVRDVVTHKLIGFNVVGFELRGPLCDTGVMDVVRPRFCLPRRWESMRLTLNTRPGKDRQRVKVSVNPESDADVIEGDTVLEFTDGEVVDCCALADELEPLVGKTLYLEVEYE